MKILFIADVPLENPTSGSEQVLYQQAKGLDEQGNEVFVITRQMDLPAWNVRKVNGIQEGVFRVSPKEKIRAFFSLLKFPSKFYNSFSLNTPFKAAICHQPITCLALLLWRKLKNIVVLYVFHSPSHEEFLIANQDNNLLRNFISVNMRILFERLCLKRAQKVMVLSRYMKQKVIDYHNIPADRIIVNPGGVDLHRFKPPQSRYQLKEKLGFPADKIHLLSVRNLEPRMGLDNLIKCLYVLKKKQIGVHLTIGGEGVEKKKLEDLILKYGLSDMVTMADFIPDELLPEYYGAADIFVLPTRRLEGFGLVTLESMACGTPVLGTPVGGTKEILSNFDSQLIFNDSSPEAMAKGISEIIKKYFNGKINYDKLRIHCRRYAEKEYSWQRHTDLLRSILDEITVGEQSPASTK
ncbi:glycosyltransferase family 4 protein [Thermodesulfobacteriota bacterium]